MYGVGDIYKLVVVPGNELSTISTALPEILECLYNLRFISLAPSVVYVNDDTFYHTNLIGLQPTKTRAELDSSKVLNIWNKYFTSITR